MTIPWVSHHGDESDGVSSVKFDITGVGTDVGLGVGTVVWFLVGATVVGTVVGIRVGMCVTPAGKGVVADVGTSVGTGDGDRVFGAAVGATVGSLVRATVVGTVVGTAVGMYVAPAAKGVGAGVGAHVGIPVGSEVGAEDGDGVGALLTMTATTLETSSEPLVGKPLIVLTFDTTAAATLADLDTIALWIVSTVATVVLSPGVTGVTGVIVTSTFTEPSLLNENIFSCHFGCCLNDAVNNICLQVNGHLAGQSVEIDVPNGKANFHLREKSWRPRGVRCWE